MLLRHYGGKISAKVVVGLKVWFSSKAFEDQEFISREVKYNSTNKVRCSTFLQIDASRPSRPLGADKMGRERLTERLYLTLLPYARWRLLVARVFCNFRLGIAFSFVLLGRATSLNAVRNPYG